MTIIPSWLRVRRKLNRQARRAAARRCRPCLERLEDRTTPATFTVTNTLDDGSVGSLRWAITQVNADPDPMSNINFNIPGSGVQTISVTSDLPLITHPVVINGYSQPGSSANTQAIGDNAVRLITLDGTHDAGGFNNPETESPTGLTLIGGNSTVRGLTISNFSTDIWLPTAGSNVIAGDAISGGVCVYLGDFAGLAEDTPIPSFMNTNNAPVVVDNLQAFIADPTTIPVITDSVVLEQPSYNLSQHWVFGISDNNVIGGTSLADRNIIDTGLLNIFGSYNRVEGNYIGVDATGMLAAPGTGFAAGVRIQMGSYNTIGGTTPGTGNVIVADSTGIDVDIGFSSLDITSHNVVQGNFLGTNATGDAALDDEPSANRPPFGQGSSGVFLGSVTAFDLIGGPTTGAGNLISGHFDYGIYDGDPDNVIQGNLVGTDATGTRPIPNGDGIRVNVGQGTLVGGSVPGEGNVVAFNSGGGPDFGPPGTGLLVRDTGARIIGNSIHDNESAGVEVTDEGQTNVQITSNSIYDNGGPGVWVHGNPFDISFGDIDSGIDIQRNSIYGNAMLGIDLGAIPVTRFNVQTTDITTWDHDIPDNTPQNGSAVGINNGQTFPCNLTASATGSSVSISGTLQSPNAGQQTLDFYGNASPDSSGFGQGQAWLGETTIDSGQTSFVANLAVGNLAAEYITATATDKTGDTSEFAKDVQATTAQSQTFAQYMASVLPQSSTLTNSMTIEASTNTTPATVIDGVNHLTNVTQPVTIILDLMGGTWSSGGVTANPPPNVTFEIKNGTLDPTYPALTVAGGLVEVTNCTLTTSGDNPTILVTGGNLSLRNDTVQESTVSNDPAIKVTGGTLDLGTTASPGGDIVNINGVGQLVCNTTANIISAVGTTFEDNGIAIQPSSLLGFVWADFNNNGQIDFGENGLSGVSIHLQGSDFLGRSVDLTTTTDASGSYQFSGLMPGSYAVTAAQPAGYTAGIDSVGTVNGILTGSVSGANQFTIYLPDSVNAMNYNFGELPANGGSAQHGQTAGIGFWNNKNGQALIKSLNGGSTSMQLGNWLADTFKNMYGANAGSNDLAGLTNAQVAAVFQQKFVVKGQKLDAQVMATALSVYVTNQTLAGSAAAAYGFTVTQYGVGIATINVGNDGAAVAQANGTTLSIMDILLAADSLSANDNGVLYGGDTTKRNEANDLFSAINLDGGI